MIIIFLFFSTRRGSKNGVVFPTPMPAITSQLRPRRKASDTSNCQGYGMWPPLRSPKIHVISALVWSELYSRDEAAAVRAWSKLLVDLSWMRVYGDCVHGGAIFRKQYVEGLIRRGSRIPVWQRMKDASCWSGKYARDLVWQKSHGGCHERNAPDVMEQSLHSLFTLRSIFLTTQKTGSIAP